MAASIVFTLRIENDHYDFHSAEDLYEQLRTLLEEELVNGSLADESNPISGLEITYHLE